MGDNAESEPVVVADATVEEVSTDAKKEHQLTKVSTFARTFATLGERRWAVVSAG